jgi:hypothetical protein
VDDDRHVDEDQVTPRRKAVVIGSVPGADCRAMQTLIILVVA